MTSETPDILSGFEPHDTLTSRELSAELRISKLTLYKWVKNGGLPCRSLGAAGFRFQVGRVRDWVEKTGRARSMAKRAATMQRDRDESGRFVSVG